MQGFYQVIVEKKVVFCFKCDMNLFYVVSRGVRVFLVNLKIVLLKYDIFIIKYIYSIIVKFDMF